MKKELDYYASHGMMTAPGEYGWMLAALPDDIPDLVKAIQGLMIHVFWAERYGMPKADIREEEVGIRQVEPKLARIMELDPSPVTDPRTKEKKLVGNCRDFSLLLTSALRHKGIPARARCGFGLYFMPDHFEDHWVCEYWDAEFQRWIMVDPQLDNFQQTALKTGFNTLNMPEGKFWTGGKAWLACREGKEDPQKFGIFDMKGLWFVRGNLLRDLASLNKVEVLPWDAFGLISKKDAEITSAELQKLDRIAELTTGSSKDFEEIQAAYQSDPDCHPTEDLWQSTWFPKID